MRLLGHFLLLVTAAGLVVGCQSFRPEPVSPTETASALEARSLQEPRLRDFLQAHLRKPLPVWPLATWDFETLKLATLFFHPGLDVARAQWNVAKARIITAGARPNPTVGITPEYTFNPASGMIPWIATLDLDIPIETAGKRAHRITRAEYRAVAARLSLLTVAWQVRSNLRSALLDFTSATQREKLLESQRALQEEVTRRLEQKLRAGAIETLELSRARFAVARSQVEAGDARRQASEALPRVAESIGVPASALTGLVLVEDWSLPAETDLVGGDARNQALRNRPDVLAALAEYEASQSDLQLEIAKQYPDIHLGPGYQFDQGENKWALGVTVEIPVLNRNEGPIAEAQARRAEAAALFVLVQANAIAEIDRALAAYGNTQERLRSFETLRDAQRAQATSLGVQVQAGAAEPLDLLAIRVEEAVTEVLEWDTRVQVVRAFGQLEQAIQRPFDTPDAIDSPRNASAGNPQP